MYILDFSGVALEFLMILYITNNSFLWNKFIDMNKVKHFNSWIEMSLWTMIHDMWNHALPSTIGFINGSSAVLTSSQIIVSILITHGLCDEKNDLFTDVFIDDTDNYKDTASNWLTGFTRSNWSVQLVYSLLWMWFFVKLFV